MYSLTSSDISLPDWMFKLQVQTEPVWTCHWCVSKDSTYSSVSQNAPTHCGYTTLLTGILEPGVFLKPLQENLTSSDTTARNIMIFLWNLSSFVNKIAVHVYPGPFSLWRTTSCSFATSTSRSSSTGYAFVDLCWTRFCPFLSAQQHTKYGWDGLLNDGLIDIVDVEEESQRISLNWVSKENRSKELHPHICLEKSGCVWIGSEMPFLFFF